MNIQFFFSFSPFLCLAIFICFCLLLLSLPVCVLFLNVYVFWLHPASILMSLHTALSLSIFSGRSLSVSSSHCLSSMSSCLFYHCPSGSPLFLIFLPANVLFSPYVYSLYLSVLFSDCLSSFSYKYK